MNTEPHFTRIDISKLTLEQVWDIKKQLSEAGLLSFSKEYRPRQDYTSWDWSKSNIELMREHDCSAPTVANWRRKLGKQKPVRSKYYPECLKWDWTKSNADIAREHGLEVNSVRNLREKLGIVAGPTDLDPHLPRNGSKLISGVDVDVESLDWTHPDIALARSTGLTRERIRQVRIKLNKPKTHFKERKFRDFEKAFTGREILSYDEARKEFSTIAPQTFRIYCDRIGINYLRRETPSKIPWDKMNWDLPNTVLTEIWRIKAFNSVASHRCNHTLPKPKLRRMGNGLFYGSIPQSDIPALIDSEKSKAIEHYDHP